MGFQISLSLFFYFFANKIKSRSGKASQQSFPVDQVMLCLRAEALKLWLPVTSSLVRLSYSTDVGQHSQMAAVELWVKS